MVDNTFNSGGILVNPSRNVLEQAVDSGVEMKVLMQSSQLKDAVDDFTFATDLADAIHSGQISIRTVDELDETTLYATEDTMTVFVMMDGEAGQTVEQNEPERAADVYSEYSSQFESADEPSIRVPPKSELLTSLNELSPEIADDFEDIISDADEISRSENLDEVAAVLLLGAKHEALLYEVGKWGEDSGLASKATFSRVKNRLEEEGYIDTEKVPIDVGRPRLRLALPDSSDVQSVEEITNVVEASN